MRGSFRHCFCFLFLFFLFGIAALSRASDSGVPAAEISSENVPAASVPASEKIFYKLSVNETFFIRRREAVINANVFVEILQGEPDKISLEICGNGEVAGVSGENVRDWSIRRNGARSFLEIRPKNLNGEKKFKLIVMGRQSLKLPTTLSPMIFSGVDSAAFSGIVRFMSSVDLRLYAKQERGLIPLGNRSRNEINYVIQGAEPSLRLDVATAGDLLEPVSLDDFSLIGDVEENGARFRMKGKARVREIGAEVLVLTGNAALMDFPANNGFLVLAKTNEASGATEYSLRFPARGEFDVDLSFAAEIKSVDGWRQMNFSIPLVQVAPFSLRGMPRGAVFSADNISLPQLGENGEFSGFLPSSGKLDLRWRASIPTPPEFSAGIYSVDAVTEMQLTTGVLKQRSEFDFSISQGEISSLLFEIFGNGEILDVSGQDLLSWTLIPLENGRRGLFVQLSQPKTGKYRLRAESQTRTTELPKTLSPLRLVPAGTDWEGRALSSICVRNNEILRLRSGIGVRCEALPQTGMAQVVASEFPSDRDFFEESAPTEEVAVYRLSSGMENLCVRADFVRSELIVTPRVRWLFGSERISSAHIVNFQVRDAPLYEMQILVPENQEIVLVNSAEIFGYEISENAGKAGYRLLNLVFSEPLIGDGKVSLTLRQPRTADGNADVLRPCLFPQAHFVHGMTGLSAPKKIRLLPEKFENLTEVTAAEYSEENPPQLAFRMRNGEWNLSVRSEPRATELSGDSVCVYKIDEKKIFGNCKIDYAPGGVPVARVRLAFPQKAKVLALSGDGVRDWSADESGAVTVSFSSEKAENFSVVASFEEPREIGKMQAFEGVRLLDVSGERGTILITADRVITMAGEESVLTLAPLPLEKIREDFSRVGGAILFRAYQFVERPFRLSLETRLPEADATPPLVVTEARISANADESCDIVYRFRALGATDLKIAVPAGMKIAFDGARTLPDGTFVLPLLDNAAEIALRMERVADERGTEISHAGILAFPRVFAPVMRTVFVASGVAESENMDVSVPARRGGEIFGATFPRRFVSAFENWHGVFSAAITGMLLALFAPAMVKTRFSRGICFALAVFAGTGICLTLVFSFAGALLPEYGETVLTAGMTEPGAQLSVALRPFVFCRPESATLPAAILAIAFGFGILLAFAGTAFRRKLGFLRVAGRILLYAAGTVFVAEDFPHRVPAFVAMAIVTEISSLLVHWLARFVSIFSDGKNLPPKNPSVSALALLVFAALVPAGFSPQARAGDFAFAETPEIVAEETETPHDVADRITQAIDVRGDRVVARGDIRVTGYAGDRFDLLASPAVLTSFERAPGAMLRLERRRAGNSEFVYQVVLERAGTFSANFSYEFALAENARGFPILTGAAAADVVTLLVPRAEVQISAKGAVTANLSAFGEKSQIAQIVFRPKAVREVKWNPRERDRSGEAERLFVSGENLYVPAPGLIEGFHAMKFVPAQGEVSRVRIKIPKPFSVSRLEGTAIHRWSFNRETGLLNVLFAAPRVEPFSLSIFTQAQLSVLPVAQKFAAPDAIDSCEQVRTIGIAAGEGIQVDSVSAAGLSVIDEDEYSESLESAGMKIGAGLRLRRAFKTVGKNGEFSAELSAVRPNLQIEAQENFFVNGDSVSAKIDFSASVSRAEIFRMEFRLPDGLDVDEIRGEMLGYWTKSAAADGSGTLITMHLKNALEGKQDFEVALSGAFPKNAKEWTLPNFSIAGAKIQRGEIRVNVDEGLRLKPISPGVTLLAGTDGGNDAFGFRYFNRKSDSPKFLVLESRPFTNVAWLHRVSPHGRFARSRVDMILEIENVARSSARVRLPENALAVRYFGEEIVAAEKVAGTPGLWELKFSKPQRGRVDAAVEFFTELPVAPTAKIVPVSVEDADRQSAWLAAERGEIFTALRSHSPEKVSADDVPADLRAALAGADWFVEKFAEKYEADLSIAPKAVAAWHDSLSDEHHDSFRAEMLARDTVFSRDSALTEDRIRLSVARSDLLRIKLPQGGELKALALDGVAVPVVFAADGEDSCVFLPVFSRGGQTVSVFVVYTHPVRQLSRGEKRAVEIVPAEILATEKLAWNLRAREGEAEVAEIFGREPDAFRTPANAVPAKSGEFLGAYFGEKIVAGTGENADELKLVPAPRETFFAAGTEISKARAVVILHPAKSESRGFGFEILMIFLAVLLFLKGFAALRSRKKRSE